MEVMQMCSVRTVRALSAVALASAPLGGCGGGMSGPTPQPAPVAPTISNLAANFAATGCIRSADGLAGRALVITFDYSDAPGNLAGGRVQLTRLYNTGRSETHFFLVPSEVTVSGVATSGQIRISNACPLYNDATNSKETLSLIDASGNPSNGLSTTVNRPAGAP
jgi:hypothetical protein